MKNKMTTSAKLITVLIVMIRILTSHAKSTEYILHFHFVYPCSDMTINKELWLDRKREVFDCLEIYNNQWVPAVEQAFQCNPPHKLRGKRELIGNITKIVLSAATNFIKSSSMIGLIDRQTIINTVYNGLNLLNMFRSQIRDYLNLSTETGSHHPMRLEAAALHMDKRLWIAFKYMAEILTNTANLDTITSQCAQGKVATRELAELTGEESLSSIHPDNTTFISIRPGQHRSTIIFTFLVNNREDETTRDKIILLQETDTRFLSMMSIFISVSILIILSTVSVMYWLLKRTNKSNEPQSLPDESPRG